jgi:hypothetical protein
MQPTCPHINICIMSSMVFVIKSDRLLSIYICVVATKHQLERAE